jgi:hypothetical protein
MRYHGAVGKIFSEPPVGKIPSEEFNEIHWIIFILADPQIPGDKIPELQGLGWPGFIVRVSLDHQAEILL